MLFISRRWSYEYIKKLFPGSSGARSAHGAGTAKGTQFTVGRHPVNRSTAKANNLEPYAYLRRVFTELPKAEPIEAIEAVLPGNIDQIKTG